MTMKNIYKILSCLVVASLAFHSCDKEPDLPWGSFDDMEIMDDFYVYNLNLTEDIDGINDDEPENYQNQLVVSHVRGEHQNLDVILMFNDGSAWHGPYNVETAIASLPLVIAIDGEKLVDLIPSYNSLDDIVLGHQYLFGLRVTSREGVEFETLEIINGSLRRKLSSNLRNYPGASYEALIRAIRFCGYPMEDYVGIWSGTSQLHAETVVTELEPEPNKLRIFGLADFVSSLWGEEWVEGDGSCVLEFSCGELVTIPKQWIGSSDFPDDYEIEGFGTFDPESKTIVLTYEVFYTGGSVDGIETTLRLGSEKQELTTAAIPVR